MCGGGRQINIYLKKVKNETAAWDTQCHSETLSQEKNKKRVDEFENILLVLNILCFRLLC